MGADGIDRAEVETVEDGTRFDQFGTGRAHLTTNPTWDVMLSIAEGLDVPMDEFSTRQNKRTIRENEMNHMQKYRVLGSSGRQAVDECLEREYVQWLRLLQKKGSRISYKETIDRIYDLDKEKLDRLLSLLDELERRGQL